MNAKGLKRHPESPFKGVPGNSVKLLWGNRGGAFLLCLLYSIFFAPIYISIDATAEDLPAVGQVAAGQTGASMDFDIPSQALEDALSVFDTMTGIEVFVDGGTIRGRRSAAIRGVFTPEQALQALLNGSGLEAKSIGTRAITLMLSPQKSPNSLLYRRYSARVQTAVAHVLCDAEDTQPGAYRIAMQLWLTSSGNVASADLLSSTGDLARDRRLYDALLGVSVGAPPPPSLPQPVILVILPRPTEESGDCG